MATLRGFRESDDDGFDSALMVDRVTGQTRRAGASFGGDQLWGKQVEENYWRDKRNNWWDRVQKDPKMMQGGPPQDPTQLRGAGWSGYVGIKRSLHDAAEAQGRNMRIIGSGTGGRVRSTTLPVTWSDRPSMRALAQPQPADDGWEHPDVRAAKLRILQEQGNEMVDERLRRGRYNDENLRAHDASVNADIFVNTTRKRRGVEREQGIQDVREAATEKGTNPWLREETDFDRGLARDRASMDAFARILGQIRPETAELFENNPELMDTIRDRTRVGATPTVAQRQQAPAVTGGGGTSASAVDLPAAAPDYGEVSSARDIPPVMRMEIEQYFREQNPPILVNDSTLMQAYNRLRSR